MNEQEYMDYCLRIHEAGHAVACESRGGTVTEIKLADDHGHCAMIHKNEYDAMFATYAGLWADLKLTDEIGFMEEYLNEDNSDAKKLSAWFESNGYWAPDFTEIWNQELDELWDEIQNKAVSLYAVAHVEYVSTDINVIN